MIQGLKYHPLKSAVTKTKKRPKILFYKATGCKNAKCAKGAEGTYNVCDTETGRFLGSIKVTPRQIDGLADNGADYTELSNTLHRSGYLRADGKTVKLPYSKEYNNVYSILAYEDENLTSEEQKMFARESIELLKNLSDKFKRPIVLERHFVPGSMKLYAITSHDFVAIPYCDSAFGSDRKWYESGHSIDGKEMGKRCNYFISGNGVYSEQTYMNIDRYLKKNDIYSLIYAEYAVHPKVRKPGLITATKELYMDAKRIFGKILRNINNALNKKIEITI